MVRLEDLSLIKRIALAVVIVVCVLLLLMFASWLVNEPADAQGLSIAPLPPKGAFVGKPSPWDQHLIELDRVALDDAYHDRIVILFSSWMRDDTDQPERISNGVRQARRAYILVRTAIEQRQKELADLLPPPAPEKK